jgi:hypothetical protein
MRNIRFMDRSLKETRKDVQAPLPKQVGDYKLEYYYLSDYDEYMPVYFHKDILSTVVKETLSKISNNEI